MARTGKICSRVNDTALLAIEPGLVLPMTPILAHVLLLQTERSLPPRPPGPYPGFLKLHELNRSVSMEPPSWFILL